MNELIRIEEKDGIETVNARELHDFLGNRRKYADWIKQRIQQYGFIDGTDFTIHKFVNGRISRNDYHITVDMAKELSMVENNEKGKQARRYFIEVEKKAKQEYLSGGNTKQVNDMLNRILAMNEQIVNMLPKITEPTHKIKTESDIRITQTETAKMFLKPFSEKSGRHEIKRWYLYDQYKDYCEIKSCEPLGKKNFYEVVRNTGAVDLKKHGYDNFIFM